MSEYQYYEFQAIERPLSAAEMQTLRRYSTRAHITPTSFVNEYHWGDFKGDPDAWVERYFDAFLYFANWGTRIVKLRLSARALDPKVAREYFAGESSSVRGKGGQVILTMASERDDWEDADDLDGRALLASLIPLRADLARGDRRALYLAWLAAVDCGEVEDDAIEPPVPAGLGELNPSLAALAHFLRIDPDLIDVAAQASAPLTASKLDRDEVLAWVRSLSLTQKDEVLTRLVCAADDAASVSAELVRGFLRAHDARTRMRSRGRKTRRTVGDLCREAEKSHSGKRRLSANR